MRHFSATALALASVVFALSPLEAQKKSTVPKRPKLQATTDTNDYHAYYRLGEQMLDRDARLSADAFYWAVRINPYSAEALYGLRSARHLADPWRFKRYMEDDRKTIESAEVKQIDSLLARAFMLNPFLYRKYDQIMMRSYIHNAVNSSAGADRPSPGELDYVITQWLARGGPESRAWMAYSEGRFGDALRNYAEAAKGTKRKARVRMERGRIFYLMGNADSALAELRAALEELRKQDNKELVRVYDSKAVLEHSIAKIYEMKNDLPAAREAYGRALEEDLSFYPAHFHLANLAFAAGDTVTGINEMELAIQINGDDPVVRLVYGYVLSAQKRYTDAEAHLMKAIALEPYYPNLYHVLGQVYEAQKKRAEAIAQYEAYLARASTSHPQRAEAIERLARLRTQASGGGQ